MSETAKRNGADTPRFLVGAKGAAIVRIEDIASIGISPQQGPLQNGQRQDRWLVIAFRRGESWQMRVPTYGIPLGDFAQLDQAQAELRRLAKLLDPAALVVGGSA